MGSRHHEAAADLLIEVGLQQLPQQTRIFATIKNRSSLV